MIRKYEDTDVEDVLTAWESASQLAHPFLSEEFLATERHNIPNLYLPNAETWVWEANGQVVGFIALIGNEIGGLFLDPNFHGQGIGRALLSHARELKGELEVEVFEANHVGRSFYDKCGFVLSSPAVHEPTGLNILRMKLAARSSRSTAG